MYLLGYDIGSSSVKAAILDAASGECLASAFYPSEEMPIHAKQPGWAEQDPELWWHNLKMAHHAVLAKVRVDAKEIRAIGISYQMHGLVLVDKELEVLRPSIIWCDSRATTIGDRAFDALGSERCLGNFLNSPGNFTASKLRWVKENEPEIFNRIKYFLLPGDYIALRLTGEATTTISGLSEGIFWNFKENALAQEILDHYGIPQELVAQLVPTFGQQGLVSSAAATELGLAPGIPVAYRAGDQPNNAFSLNVMEPGQVAATAGTSGVVYSVSDQISYDPQSRVNTFAHVNHGEKIRLGILLCVNGCGILNAWMRKNTGHLNYEEMNSLAATAPVGAAGLSVLPFGNGAERILQNKNIHAQFLGIDFNQHERAHLIRAAQEGIAFSFYYGMEIMQEMGVNLSLIRAAHANLFLSPLFRETLATISGSAIQLFATDGAIGAARGAGLGAGIYDDPTAAFASLQSIGETTPDALPKAPVQTAYNQWKERLEAQLKPTRDS